MAGTGQRARIAAKWPRLRGAEGVAIAEFAVSLPLLLVIAVGIFDFGGAFNVKQKLDNAVREGARYGSKLPLNDLPDTTSAPAPPSVDAIRNVVSSYLKAAKIDDCGLRTTVAGSSTNGLIWTYTTGACPGGGALSLTIDRGNNNPGAIAAPFGAFSVYVLATDVKLAYPYHWQFNRVFTLLSPSANYTSTTITTEAFVPNMP